MTSTDRTPQTPHRVVVIGPGFGGLFGTKALRRSDVEVTMVAKTTHHLFQPLLYQVATGILSEGEIAPPTREVLSGQKNARVLLGEVTDIDLERRTVRSHVLGRQTVSEYDSLIVAAWMRPAVCDSKRSTSVPQAWHSGHCPNHFSDAAPHSVHLNAGCCLVLGGMRQG